MRVEEGMYLAFLIRPCWSLWRHNKEDSAKVKRGTTDTERRVSTGYLIRATIHKQYFLSLFFKIQVFMHQFSSFLHDGSQDKRSIFVGEASFHLKAASRVSKEGRSVCVCVVVGRRMGPRPASQVL